MSRRLASRIYCALLACTAAPAAAAPTGASTPATGTVLVARPLALTKGADLDFGALIASTAGTAVIDPDANTEVFTGGLSRAFGSFNAASFTGAGSPLAVAVVTPPSGPVTLTRTGGTETMTVTNLGLQRGVGLLGGSTLYAILGTGTYTFRVGGTLNAAANQAEGNYSGTFTVTANYL